VDVEKSQDPPMRELIYVNGINGSTGQYQIAPMTPEELVRYIMREQEPPYQDLLVEKTNKSEAHYAPVYGIDARNLAEAGWGIIYGAGIGPEIKEALSPLRRLRAAQSGALFKTYTYRGESSRRFLSDNDTGLGAADPKEMPYYLLIVGSPEEIPFNFQYELDVDRAVGRLYFATVSEYDNYGRSVVAAERGDVRLPRRASFFSVANPDDPATELSTTRLVEPLYDDFKAELTRDTRSEKWDVRAYMRDDATRTTLSSLFGGSAGALPAFLFTASHGMAFNRGDRYQVAHQGALVCQDWNGNPATISEDVYFAGEHIADDDRLHGLITFLFACYGAGTPAYDEFMRKVAGTARPIAPAAFLSSLPRRMLGHPRGGALAVVGHIERVWTHSFLWPGKTRGHRAHFTSTLGRLFDGYPVGYAFDYINERHASASVQLVSLLEKKRKRIKVSDIELIQTWALNNDARDYIILGDPAVRLCVPETQEEAVRPSVIELAAIDLAQYRPASVPGVRPGSGQTSNYELHRDRRANNHRELTSAAVQRLSGLAPQTLINSDTVEVLS
jgi:hypothetical protein